MLNHRCRIKWRVYMRWQFACHLTGIERVYAYVSITMKNYFKYGGLFSTPLSSFAVLYIIVKFKCDSFKIMEDKNLICHTSHIWCYRRSQHRVLRRCVYLNLSMLEILYGKLHGLVGFLLLSSLKGWIAFGWLLNGVLNLLKLFFQF